MIGTPCPPVSQYQRRVSGICATPSLAGTCAGMGMGLIGLTTVWPSAVSIGPVPSAAKPAASLMVRRNAPAGRAQLEAWLLPIVAVLPSVCPFFKRDARRVNSLQAVEKGSPASLRSIASLQRIGKYASARASPEQSRRLDFSRASHLRPF